MRSRTIGRLLVALALAVLGAAADARAQQLIRVADVASRGGYVRSSDTTTVWAEVAGGRVRRGYVVIERRFRGGSLQPLVMTGQIDAAETLTLWTRLLQARPWARRQVRAQQTNTDFPDTVVTYMGAFTQEILAGNPPASLPLVSAEMTRFLDEAARVAAATAAADLFAYDAAGNRSGYHRAVRIAQDGTITDDVTYMASGFTPYSKQGALTSSEVNEVKRLCAGWARYPAAFPGNPGLYDGIGITTTLTSLGFSKTVFAGEEVSRPADYQRILDRVAALADAIP